MALVSTCRTAFFRTCRLTSGWHGLRTGAVMCREASKTDREKKVALLKLEMELEKQSGNFFVPDHVGDDKWEELLRMTTPVRRRSYYRYLKRIELDEAKIKRRRGLDVEQYRNRIKELNVDRGGVEYRLGKNRLFLSITKKSLNKIYHANLFHAVAFGQKVVFDMGYEKAMDQWELTNTVDQIVYAYTAVKRDRDAFNLHFCNVPPAGRTEQKLKKAMPLLYEPKPLMELTRKSYLDLFPKERLVYLVPNCGIDLEYDPQDVYIVGGVVDHQGQGSLSLAKAKREDLRMAQFPLDKYLRWRGGSKDLTIDQVVKILISIRDTRDWMKTLRQHVPARKFYSESDNGRLDFHNRFAKKLEALDEIV